MKPWFPYSPLLYGLNVECTLDDCRPLQTSDDECIWLGSVCAHDLTSLHSEFVEGLGGTLRLVFVADQRTIFEQQEVP